jgi:hypothetical protein
MERLWHLLQRKKINGLYKFRRSFHKPIYKTFVNKIDAHKWVRENVFYIYFNQLFKIIRKDKYNFFLQGDRKYCKN